MKKNDISKSDERKIELSATAIGAFVVFALGAMGFVKIAWELRDSETTMFDTAILQLIRQLQSPFLDTFMSVLTDFGGVIVVSAATLITIALFVLKKEYIRATMVTMAMGGAVVLNLVLKSVFERARPDLWDRLVNESSYSFPSGHSMVTAALGFTLIVVLWNSRYRWWAVGFGVAYPIIIGFTRLYLGVHYPTDIVGGWLVSAAWVAASALIIQTSHARQAFSRRRKS